MEVPITSYHIENGLRYHTSLCPLGLAIAGAGGYRISVQQTSIRFRIGEADNYWDVDEETDQFIEDFDEQRSVEPFTLILE